MSGNFYDHILHLFGDTNGLKEAVVAGQEARKKIFYADSLGIPTGFDVPAQSLERECQISLSLIWAAIDITRQKGNLIPLVVQALRTANIIIAEVGAKK